ncbi:RDD family protein [Streptomyces sp. G-G2]|uniref:RDD family protein n=1 Tax=Streptomyces sp. G-G2 TaxID=3046201 RepID=UPI0024BB5AD9|nr:RDD family protein [Streptomyces sp. G-G2]MDJ0379607.1 RDD family protein [Streptomyces sp. G-G2]
MSTDQPPPGQPPEDDPFLKKPQQPTPPSGGSPYGSPPPPAGGPPPGGPPPGGPPPGGGHPPGGGGYPPPPPPYGGGGDPYGGSGGGGYGMPDPLAGMPPLAPFGKRLAARVIDALIIGIPLYVLELIFSSKRYVVDTNKGDDVSDVVVRSYSGSGLIWTLIGILAYVGYDWFMTKRNGQTLGKKLMGLRVAMLNDGGVPPSNASLTRAAVLWLPTLICCFCLWPIALVVSVLIDKPYKQGWHDKAAKTVVVTATP